MASALHVERMKSESAELGDRITKLRAFRDGSHIYAGLTDSQRSLLAAQLQAMSCYKTVLDLRLQNETSNEGSV